MRYPACEKREIIQFVEQSHLPVMGGACQGSSIVGWQALGDRSPHPDRVWNRIPDVVRERILKLALKDLYYKCPAF